MSYYLHYYQFFLKKSVDFLVNFEQFMFDEYRTYEL